VPSAATVASTIAVGSGRTSAWASDIHQANCVIGSAAIVPSDKLLESESRCVASMGNDPHTSFGYRNPDQGG
jgi:hypothetical protein